MGHWWAHLQSHHITHQDGDSSWLCTFCSCAILVIVPRHFSIKKRRRYIWEHLPMHWSLPARKKQSDIHSTASAASKCNSCYNSWQTKAEVTAHQAMGSLAGAFLHQLLHYGQECFPNPSPLWWENSCHHSQERSVQQGFGCQAKIVHFGMEY